MSERGYGNADHKNRHGYSQTDIEYLFVIGKRVQQETYEPSEDKG
jgi:hypothetical protein